MGDTGVALSPTGSWPSEKRRVWVGIYVKALVFLALVLLGYLVYAQMHRPDLHPTEPFRWLGCALLLLLAVFAEMYTVRVASGLEVSAGFLIFFLSGAILGPLVCFGIAVASQLPGLRRREWGRTTCMAASVGIVAGCTSLLYWVTLSHLNGSQRSPVLVLSMVGLAAGTLYHALSLTVAAPVIWLRLGIGLKRVWREGIKPFLAFDVFFLIISVGLVSVYRIYQAGQGGGADLRSKALVILCLLPGLGLIYAFHSRDRHRELAEHNAHLAQRNERLALQAVASQVTALDLKDDYTARHSATVAQWATDISRSLGLHEGDQNLAHLAGLLHDVGKIGVPDEVLKSTGYAGPNHRFLLECHCEHGYRILRNIDQFERLAKVVLHHHERYDGNGYPHGIAGSEIPLISRIICVADSYSAMVSDRPYRPSLTTDMARRELHIMKGTQFDPDVVDSFLTLLAGRDDEYRRGLHTDFDSELQQIMFLRDLPLDQNKGWAPVASASFIGARLARDSGRRVAS